MRAPRPLWILLLSLSLSLAGCASPSDGGGANGAGADDPGFDETDGGDGSGPGSGGDGGAADGEDGSGSGSGERWYAYAFTQEVTPRSGGSGTIESFRYELAQENDGEELVLDVTAEVVGTSTQDIRTLRMNGTDFTQSTVSAPLEVTEIKHTIQVVRDDSGEREAGATATVHAFVPTQELEPYQTFLLDFAKMTWTDEAGATGGWEYFVTSEMQAEQDAGGAFFLPHQEGGEDFTGWWGYEVFVMTYAPTWLGEWTSGEQTFEEGESSFGGYSYSSQRKTLEVGGYAFDGWRVEWSAEADGSTGTYMFEVAPTLPIPFAYNFGGSDATGSGGTSSNHWRFQLKDLSLS